MVASKPHQSGGEMRTNLLKLCSMLLILGMVLSACNLPGNAVVTEAPVPTEAPPTETVEPSSTPTEIPTTETPTITPTETLTPEPSATFTPEPPMAKVGRETNCRIGPAGNYDLVATYQEGQLLEVVAKDLGAGYWFVRNPEKPEDECYLLANNVTITGDTSILPKFTPLPSPTAAPYFNVTFKKFDTCKSDDYAIFIIENTGSVAFRSAYIRVTDSKAKQTVEHVVNAFDLWTGCIIAQNVAPLEGGATGYTRSPSFKWNARGHVLQGVFQLCTEKDLKGTCVIRTIEFSQ
jgi:hypothetical protein